MGMVVPQGLSRTGEEPDVPWQMGGGSQRGIRLVLKEEEPRKGWFGC